MGQEQSVTPISTTASSGGHSSKRRSWFGFKKPPPRESTRVFNASFNAEPGAKDLRESRVVKVLVLGDCGSGKSSIVERYCLGLYNIQHVPTVGPKLTSCELTGERVQQMGLYPHDIRVQFVELPQQETAGDSTTLQRHASEADGVLFVVDSTRAASALFFDRLLPRVKSFAREDCLLCVFLHKSDRKTPRMPLRKKGADTEYAAAAGLCHIASTTSVSTKVIDANVGVLLSKILAEGRGPDGCLAARVGRPSPPLHPMGSVCPAEVGSVDEERVRLVEGHIAAFLNVHTQILGDYKKQHALATGSSGRNVNQRRCEVSSLLEVELQRECERLLQRLRKLRPNLPLTSVGETQEFLAISSHFYCTLLPCWSVLPNELSVESTIAHARGLAKMKSSPVLKSAQQMVQPPAVFISYLIAASERLLREEGAKELQPGAQTCLSPDTLMIGTSALSTSSNINIAASADSWEGSSVMAGNSGGRIFSGEYPAGLGMTPRHSLRDNSPPGSHLGAERRATSATADRHLLKVLSQNKADLKQLKDFLSRAHRDSSRLHRQRAVSNATPHSKTMHSGVTKPRARRNSHGQSQMSQSQGHATAPPDDDNDMQSSRRSTLDTSIRN